MLINFNIKNISVNDADKEYIKKKAESLLKFIDKQEEDVRFDIVLSKDSKHLSGEVYRTDITVVAGKLDMHAVGHGESLFASVDIAKDELSRRLRRNKRKEINLLRTGGRMLKKMLRRQK